MKKLILSITLCVLGAIGVNAQCTPGANYADSTFGVWPDTLVNFPPATQSVSYTTDLNFKVPINASDIDPTYPMGVTIQNFTVNSVAGLPPGMNYGCNVSGCTYAGGANGCAQITGACAVPGTYNITINLTATVLLGGIGVPVPQSFTGYKIIVGTLGLVTVDASNVVIFPNPVLDQLTLEGLSEYNFETIEIFNATGQVVKTIKLEDLNKLELNVADLNSGIYMVHLKGANGTSVKKFIKQ